MTTILVIDDNDDTRSLVAFLLRQHGYNVVLADDGINGLDQADATPPDLILMDLAMPVLDGWVTTI